MNQSTRSQELLDDISMLLPLLQEAMQKTLDAEGILVERFEECIRADQSVICQTCSRPYGKHDNYPIFPWCTILCDGKVVKL